jgi:hydrogenase maturation protein HypF
MDHEKNKFRTNRIKVYGIVQGVGFRPLVYHIANKHGIRGFVRNVGGYVEILAQAEQEPYQRFLTELIRDSGRDYEIVRYEEEAAVSDGLYQDFVIVESESSAEVSILPPDLPVCQSCLEELFHTRDRRYLNPFISCAACGPRYTIMEELPYDRDTTVMKDFTMCESCRQEYLSPENRRHHAQTISCNDCGPYLIYREKQCSEHAVEYERLDRAAFSQAAATLKSGGIVAVKGIGGYHFVCSPFIEESVIHLRRLKGREEKPFAVMFESLESMKEYCNVSKEEEKLLSSKARPIVLLTIHKEELAPSTNQGSLYCGAFLPYTPLQQLLTRECGPLIMTSANLSGRPIIRADEEMLSLESPYLNGVLYHKRRIVRSVDDSVARVIDQKPQLIRRSRGYVPYPVFLSYDREKDNHQGAIFATGGDLKAAYCLYHKGSAIVSQYFGDMEEEAVLTEYVNSFKDLSRLYMHTPDIAVCDLHPNYHSTHFAKSLGIPVLQVQHHHAHIASVMAEHELTGPILGVAFDGTGFGEDGNIWGGEFMLCEKDRYKRVAHLSYTPLLGGDSSMRDAKKTAACYLIAAGRKDYLQDDRMPLISAALEHRVNTVLSSSMGRLFDAVSALLDIGQVNHYEGECAARLEREAVKALRNHIEPAQLSFSIEAKDEIIEINPKPLLEELCRLKRSSSVQALALGFHYGVADMIVRIGKLMRERYGITSIAISGGVFQNSILTEQTCKLLRANGFAVYYNLAVPPNDGGISLGQTYIALLRSRAADRKVW